MQACSFLSLFPFSHQKTGEGKEEEEDEEERDNGCGGVR